MSIKLFNIFANTLKQNLPRLRRTDLQVRFVTAMDPAAKEETPVQIISNKNSTRFRKRQWDYNEKKKENGEGETDSKKPFDKTERVKRKKMAMLLGYCGVDYYGMQRNPGVRTIEEDLLKALCEAKYITEEEFTNQQNAHFQRSSRTDKGVSAARQVVSLKMPLETNVEELNKNLPDCVRVFGIKRVTSGFNSKGNCDARTYSYTLPTYVFEPSLTAVDERKQYRIPPEKLEEVIKVLAVYKGTKSYHNFTEKKHYQDPSASRFMMSFNVEKVFVDSDMEFAVLLVKGQSFMLHQIRKMVGLAIAVVRGNTDMATMEKAFGKDKVMIPTAPGLGLVLDMVHYDRYDVRYKSTHENLTWSELDDTVQTFKHKFIYPVIVRGELEGNNMSEWIESRLLNHTYEPSEDRTDGKEGCDEKDKGSYEKQGRDEKERERDEKEGTGEIKGSDEKERGRHEKEGTGEIEGSDEKEQGRVEKEQGIDENPTESSNQVEKAVVKEVL